MPLPFFRRFHHLHVDPLKLMLGLIILLASPFDVFTQSRLSHNAPTGLMVNAADAPFPPNEWVAVYNPLYVTPDNLLSVNWTLNVQSNEIYFSLTAKTRGWLACGFCQGINMDNNCDLFIGWVDDATNKGYLYDSFSTQHVKPPSDIELGGTNDLKLLSSSQDNINNSTTITFSRKLSTGDKFDNDIGLGPLNFVAAFGQFDGVASSNSAFTIAYHGPNTNYDATIPTTFLMNKPYTFFTMPANVPSCLSSNIAPPPTAAIQPVNGVNPICFDNPNSPIKRFTLILERNWDAGKPKNVITINGTTPGPILVFNQFDIVYITVINNLDNDTSVHFHGARQYRTPHNDGVLGLTQCPIPINGTYTYVFCADRTGTYWYHGHRSQQYADGLYGTYIVRPQSNNDIYSPQYTYDIPIQFAEWYNKPTDSYLPWFLSQASGGLEPVPDSFVINGRFSKQLAYALPSNGKVRFRFISAASFAKFNISIDGYTMTVIEVDGIDTIPYEANSIPLNVAQRVSVLVDLSQSTSWLDNIKSSKGAGVYIRAVPDFHLFDTSKIRPWLEPVVFTSLFLCDQPSNSGPCSFISSPGLVPVPPRSTPEWLQFYTQLANNNYKAFVYPLSYDESTAVYGPTSTMMPLDLNFLSLTPLYPAYQNNGAANCYTVYFNPVTQPTHIIPLLLDFAFDPYNINRGRFNGLSYDTLSMYSNIYQQPLASPIPMLHALTNQNAPAFWATLAAINTSGVGIATDGNDMDDLIANMFNSYNIPDTVGAASSYNVSNTPDGSNPWNLITPTNLGHYLLPGNTTVEYFILNTDSNSHPIHLHGYSSWMVASSDYPIINPPYMLRDVISLPSNGWIKLRFQTDNPGVWLIHCHIGWHIDAGLGALFIDNLPALQTDPNYNVKNLFPDDAQANCASYNPAIPIPPVPQGGIVPFVDSDFGTGNVPASIAAKWALLADLVIMSEAILGLGLYKLRVLDFMLPEMIGMNIGTLVGAVFIEFVHELYLQVEAGNLTYVNVATIMCVGFLFPLFVEKFFKRGQSNKFKLLPAVASTDLVAPAPAAGKVNNEFKTDKEFDLTAIEPLKSTEVNKPVEQVSIPENNENMASPIPMTSPHSAHDNLLTSQKSSGDLNEAVNGEKVNEDQEAAKVTFHDLDTLHVTEVPGKAGSIFEAPKASHDTGAPRIEMALAAARGSISLWASNQINQHQHRQQEVKNDESQWPDSSSPALASTSSPALINAINLSQINPSPDQTGNKPKEDKATNGHHRRKSSDERMEKLAEALSDKNQTTDWSLIFVVLAGEILDTFVDGGIIGAAFLSGSATGLASAAGVFMEELTHFTGSFAVFVAAGAPLWKCVIINILSAFFLMLGTSFIMLTTLIPSANPVYLSYLLAFASGSYLYVAMVDLTPLITYMQWSGYFRACSTVLSVAFGIAIQAAIAVYHWKQGTS